MLHQKQLINCGPGQYFDKLDMAQCELVLQAWKSSSVH